MPRHLLPKPLRAVSALDLEADQVFAHEKLLKHVSSTPGRVRLASVHGQGAEFGPVLSPGFVVVQELEARDDTHFSFGVVWFGGRERDCEGFRARPRGSGDVRLPLAGQRGRLEGGAPPMPSAINAIEP